MNLVIIGAGGHAKVVIDAIRLQGKYIPYAVIDEINYGHIFCGIKVEKRLEQKDNLAFVVAIGDNKTRKEKYQSCLQLGWQPATIIHPSAVIANDVSLGAGTVIFAGAAINAATVIGENCIINTGATVDHDCRLANHVHVAPGCHLAGEITIGEGSLLGIGTVAIPKRKVGNWVVAGAGAVIIDDIDDDDVVVGVPARAIKTRCTT